MSSDPISQAINEGIMKFNSKAQIKIKTINRSGQMMWKSRKGEIIEILQSTLSELTTDNGVSDLVNQLLSYMLLLFINNDHSFPSDWKERLLLMIQYNKEYHSKYGKYFNNTQYSVFTRYFDSELLETMINANNNSDIETKLSEEELGELKNLIVSESIYSLPGGRTGDIMKKLSITPFGNQLYDSSKVLVVANQLRKKYRVIPLTERDIENFFHHQFQLSVYPSVDNLRYELNEKIKRRQLKPGPFINKTLFDGPEYETLLIAAFNVSKMLFSRREFENQLLSNIRILKRSPTEEKILLFLLPETMRTATTGGGKRKKKKRKTRCKRKSRTMQKRKSNRKKKRKSMRKKKRKSRGK